MSHPDPSRNPDSLISEDVLFDWVEGRLSPEQTAQLAARSGRAGLTERMAQMQADRATLRNLATFRAPPVLLDRVLATLERDSLVGLANGTPVEDHPPISLAEYKAARAPRSPWLTRLSVAAALALLVGGATMLAVKSFAPVRSSPVAGPIALNHVDEPLIAQSNVNESEMGRILGQREDPDALVEERLAMKSAAAIPAEATAPTPIDSARAAQLAAEGRLIVRVGPARAAAAETLTARDRSWRITKTIPPTMTLAVAKAASDRSRLSRTIMADSQPSPERDARIVASLAPMIGPGAAHSFMAAPAPTLVPAAYICETINSAAVIDSMKSALETRLKAEVTFEELAEPLPAPAPEDADDLLWWTKGTNAWTPRVCVPVLIDRR